MNHPGFNQRHPRWHAALLVCGLLLPALNLPAAEAGKPVKFNPRALDGAWNRYPDLGERVDPTVQPPPPDVPAPPLKPENFLAWQEHQL
jgi:hypothetical protein